MSRQHTKEKVPSLSKQEDIRLPTGESQRATGVDTFRPREGLKVDGFGNPTYEESNKPNAHEKKFMSDINRMDGLEPTKTLTSDDYRHMSFGQPFSADDLVHAMTQSSLKPSAVQA